MRRIEKKKNLSSYVCLRKWSLCLGAKPLDENPQGGPCEREGVKPTLPPPIPLSGVMVAWTGLEHFRLGRFDPPPPANEPEDFVETY
ncbi:hypothetical protein Taro_037138 [Colocasia esculenta]|uniref:Uncharacterized protein n=1 Tax=Colocasia esculenta TaxID=4460 RepID=A0A843WFE0_COLES|nr:hypothetical protein [Colocasia esculenta]